VRAETGGAAGRAYARSGGNERWRAQTKSASRLRFVELRFSLCAAPSIALRFCLTPPPSPLRVVPYQKYVLPTLMMPPSWQWIYRERRGR